MLSQFLFMISLKLLKSTNFIMNIFLKILLITIIFSFLNNCGGLSKTKAKNVPTNAQERARKNVEEGRGASIGNVFKRGSTSYEFSSSNPLWRASLEILDFIPLTTVDYSGGMIISDWYSDNINGSESIKISIRFLSNEIRSDSVKIIVHQKNCSSQKNCKVNILNNSKIVDELRSSILRTAAIFEKEKKNKK
jgi:hypothetical protein